MHYNLYICRHYTIRGEKGKQTEEEKGKKWEGRERRGGQKRRRWKEGKRTVRINEKSEKIIRFAYGTKVYDEISLIPQRDVAQLAECLTSWKP